MDASDWSLLTQMCALCIILAWPLRNMPESPIRDHAYMMIFSVFTLIQFALVCKWMQGLANQ